MKNITYLIIIFIVGILLSTGCSKMDDSYDQYVVPGGIVYPGIAVLPKVYSGHNRVKISWIKSVDPSVIYANLMYNNYNDTLKVDMSSTDTDTISCIIDDLAENTYTFFIRTYDDKGNVSVPVECFGTVYGDNYKSTLKNRSIESFASEIITWGDADLTKGVNVGMEIKYTDAYSVEHILSYNVADGVSKLENWDASIKFEYRTLYIPDSTSIDTFYTDYEPLPPMIDQEISKKNWVYVPFDGAQGQAVFGSNKPSHLWNNNVSFGDVFACDDGLQLPVWFTVDFGEKVILSRFKLWHRPNREYNSMKYFEIWGSNDPPLDGSFDNWILLGSFESFKPSGLPAGSVSSEDRAYASGTGADFKFKSGLPAVRYWRLVDVDGWTTGSSVMQYSEISFWGQPVTE